MIIKNLFKKKHNSLFMKIYLEKEDKTINIDKDNISVKELLKELHIPESNVIVVRNNEIVTSEEVLKNKDEIKLLSVISGG